MARKRHEPEELAVAKHGRPPRLAPPPRAGRRPTVPGPPLDLHAPRRRLLGAACAIGLCVAGTAATAQAPGFLETFDDAGYRERWSISNFDQGGERFPTAWRRRMVDVVLPSVSSPGGGALRLRLAPSQGADGKPFVGAEVKKGGGHGHGSYEVYMQPARGDGLVSAFFTYTGGWFGDPHDEIDLEFLGRDTEGVWINRFVGGERLPGFLAPLGFDSANRPRLYRIEWREASVTWLVNGRELHRIDADTHEIPSHPGHLFLQIWAVNERQGAWAGVPAEDAAGEALVYCVSYRPWGDDGEECADHVADRS